MIYLIILLKEKKMKMKIILIFLLLNRIDCFDVGDFCRRVKTKGMDSECNDEYSLSCGENLCSKNEYNCMALNYFYSNTVNRYMKEMKYCSKSFKIAYKWKSSDVCLKHNTNCVYSLTKMWSSRSMIRSECDCFGKHKYKCNSDYCGLDKRSCEGLKIKKSIIKIKKCE